MRYKKQIIQIADSYKITESERNYIQKDFTLNESMCYVHLLIVLST